MMAFRIESHPAGWQLTWNAGVSEPKDDGIIDS